MNEASKAPCSCGAGIVLAGENQRRCVPCCAHPDPTRFWQLLESVCWGDWALLGFGFASSCSAVHHFKAKQRAHGCQRRGSTCLSDFVRVLCLTASFIILLMDRTWARALLLARTSPGSLHLSGLNEPCFPTSSPTDGFRLSWFEGNTAIWTTAGSYLQYWDTVPETSRWLQCAAAFSQAGGNYSNCSLTWEENLQPVSIF